MLIIFGVTKNYCIWQAEVSINETMQAVICLQLNWLQKHWSGNLCTPLTKFYFYSTLIMILRVGILYSKNCACLWCNCWMRMLRQRNAWSGAAVAAMTCRGRGQWPRGQGRSPLPLLARPLPPRRAPAQSPHRLQGNTPTNKRIVSPHSESKVLVFGVENLSGRNRSSSP